MARIIVKRNNGLWNIWSTIVDGYLFESDLTLSDFQSKYTNMRIEELKTDLQMQFEDIANEKPRSYTNEDDI